MLSLAPLHCSDIEGIVAAFAGFGWGGKDRAQYEGYLREQELGVRDVLVARTSHRAVLVEGRDSAGGERALGGVSGHGHNREQ
jgi:hypothetical protein